MKKFHYGSSLKLCLRWWRSKSDDGRLPRRIYQRQCDGRVAGGGEEGGHLPLVFPPLLPCECGIARGTGKAESVCRTACHATVLPISTGPPISHFRPLRLPLPPPPPPGSSHVPFYCCLPCPPRDPPTESLFISADDTTTGIHFNCSFRLQSFSTLRFFLFPTCPVYTLNNRVAAVSRWPCVKWHNTRTSETICAPQHDFPFIPHTILSVKVKLKSSSLIQVYFETKISVISIDYRLFDTIDGLPSFFDCCCIYVVCLGDSCDIERN